MGALISVFALASMAALFSYLSGTPSIPPHMVHFADKPALLAVKKADDSGETELISLKDLVNSRCKSIYAPFHPPWWLNSGHLQTLYCVFGDFSKSDRMWYNRTYLRVAEGGTLGLDFAPADQTKLKNDTPIVVVQHGLTGGSYEPYVRAILSRACAPVEDGGLVIAQSSSISVDALAYVASLYPNAPLLGLGFSLGSNVITRYLGEEGADGRLHSACVLACPWDLKQNNTGLLTSFTGKHIYSKGMGGNLLRLLKRHLPALLADENHSVALAAQAALKLKNPTLETFDHTFTRIAGGPAPHFPFATSEEYYIWGSSHNMVSKVTVPFLAINAADDPVVRHVPMDGGGNGLVVMELTDGGGHLGWFQPGVGNSVDRWTTKPVLEWLKLVGDDLVHDPKPKGRELFSDEDGFLRERGREHLGCKVIEGGGIIDGNGGEDGMLQGL